MNDKIINTLRAGDTITWSNGPLKFTEKTFKAPSGKLAVHGAFGSVLPLTAIRVPIKKVQTKSLTEAVDAEGKQLSVGDAVEFKADIEQVGVITKISGNNLTLSPPKNGKFYGDYIGGDKSTVQSADRVYKIGGSNTKKPSFKPGDKVKFVAHGETQLGKIIKVSPFRDTVYLIEPFSDSFTGKLSSKTVVTLDVDEIKKTK